MATTIAPTKNFLGTSLPQRNARCAAGRLMCCLAPRDVSYVVYHSLPVFRVKCGLFRSAACLAVPCAG